MASRARRLTVVWLLAGLLASCGTISGTQPAATTEETATLEDDRFVSGDIPESLDERLVRRDTDPLPDDALVRFQYISRGKSPHLNYRWLLYDDGRFFLARHTEDTSEWQTPFDTDLPDEPTAKLGWWQMRSIRGLLDSSDFMNQPSYQEDTWVLDGAYYVVTARRDGRVHEVIYVATTPPPADELLELAGKYE